MGLAETEILRKEKDDRGPSKTCPSMNMDNEYGRLKKDSCLSRASKLVLKFIYNSFFQGFTRRPPNPSHSSRVFSSCVLCSCTGRSKECFPENGTCYNCRMGSEGEHCERCQPNVDNTTDCRRCVPGYFGLTPSSGGCRGNTSYIISLLSGNKFSNKRSSPLCICFVSVLFYVSCMLFLVYLKTSIILDTCRSYAVLTE